MKKILFYDEFSALDDFFYNWNSSEIKLKTKKKLVNYIIWGIIVAYVPKSMTQNCKRIQWSVNLIAWRFFYFIIELFVKEIEFKFEIPAT